MNLKKVMALGIAASMFMSSSAAAITGTTATTSADNFRKALQEQRERLMVLESQLTTEDNLQGLKDSDQVRVIVELEGNAVIEQATAKGLRISEMNTSEIEGLQKKILKNQSSIQGKIKSNGIKFDIINSFTNVTNGFSMNTTLGEARKIESISGVKSVTIANEYDRPEPLMNDSGEITETPVAWANGYTGEGTVISIIDSGVDPAHKDLVLTDESKAELDKTEVEGIVNKESLPGKYYTEKVPYGYNYMDENSEIRDLGPDASEHGMHVAGIAGANGDVENGGIKGTAPEAQILGMKVFGNNPAMSSTFGDVIIKAIDDSVILGADVINMSLGSTASFVDDNDPEQVAVNRAVENGVVVAISAGNSDTFGSGYDNPYAENPDYGLVGSPGLATKSIQVASIENNIASGDGIEFTVNGEEKIYPYTTSGIDILTVLKEQQLKAVDCGLGGLPEHFPAEVKGNVALIQRGTYDFATKISNAEKAGAVAVIVFNNAGGGDALINMAGPAVSNIPAIFMGHSGGVLIQENAKVDGFTVSFNGKAASAHNPNAGKMADSTSWGTTPDLEFKPEITGVGGNVWSLAQNNGYRNMSGTSMASPNVAGGSALVLQRVDKLFDLTGEDRVTMAKNILMSTAIPHVDKGANQGIFPANGLGVNYTSPRRQGAGVMNLAGATETNAIVTDKATGISKVNLKEIKGDVATFTVTVENFGDKELTYNVDGTVQTDLYNEGYTLLEADNLLDANTGEFPIGFSSNTVTVAPNSTIDLMVTVDLSNAISPVYEATVEEIFENGGYVEGFVTLTSADDSAPQLSIPYVGFKGEWDKAPIIDASIYDKDRDTYYESTAMMAPTKTPGKFSYLGLSYDAEELSEADGNFIDISPDGDGYSDAVVPMVSYLRNSKEVVVEVLNSEGKVIKTLDMIKNARKHYFNGGKNVRSFLEDAKWDGTVNGKVVEDGAYTYRIRAKVDFEDAKWQNFDYKVNVDLTAPELKSSSIDKNKKTVSLVGEDNFEGHVYAYLLSTPLDMYINSTGVFDISKELASGYTMKDFEAGVSDYAQNMSIYDLGEPIGSVPGDKDAPVVTLTSPEFFGGYGSNTINFAGTVTDKSAVDVVKINGEEIPLTYNSKNARWEFSTNLNFDNGYHSVKVYSRDAAGNELEFAHKIFVDAEPPVLNLEELPAQTTESSVFIKGTATDNFPDLKVYVNGDLIEKITGEWEYFDQQKPASYTFNNYEVPLADGENTINVEIVDSMGHKTTKVITVNKVDEVVDETAPSAPTVERVEGTIVITATDLVDTDHIEYSYDLENWETYVDPISAKEGATLYAVSVDAAGNRSEATVFVIEDKTAPTAPVVKFVDGLVVAEEADEDTSYIEYSLNGKDWARYNEGVQVAEKQTVYFRAVDAAGNISELTEYTVLDITAPKAPHAYEKDGVVTAVATDDDTAKLEYSFDKEAWNEYTEPVKGEPGTVVYVRAVDAAGNVSDVVEVEISKLVIPDTTAPMAPIVTIKDGVLTIAASDDDTAKIEYSLDGKEWIVYTESVKVEENTTIHVRAMDAAGNVSEVKVYKVSSTVNPGDPTKPAAPTVVEKDGVVTVTASDDITTKLEYSLDDGKTWVPYTEPVKVGEKATISVRAVNVIDNKAAFSEVVELTVPDRTAPKAPEMYAKNNMVTIKAQDDDVDVAKIEYSIDGKATWVEYKTAVKLAAKKTMYARAIDEAGNVSEISKLTMPSSGNSLPQTGAMVGSGLMALGGAATAVFGALMLKKRNRK